MSTPEHAVKKTVKDLLHEYNVIPASKAGSFPETAQGWYFMPVPTGHGVSGIPDFIGHHRGLFFGIETKAPKKKPTVFQAMQHTAIRGSGGTVFVIDGDLGELEEWLRAIE